MKKVIKLLLIIILAMFLCIIITKYGDNKKEESNDENNWKEETEQVQERYYIKELIDTSFKGYEVCAKLEIPVISLETNILSNYSEDALNKCVVKFWGVNPNEEGNFCVVGHNFIRKNMFHNLKNLKLGDIFYVSDRKIGRVEYEVFDIYEVEPNDVSCLDAITNNEKEVTLITCTSDSKKRIIVKGKEIFY